MRFVSNILLTPWDQEKEVEEVLGRRREKKIVPRRR
jgi:hypothetical protein